MPARRYFGIICLFLPLAVSACVTALDQSKWSDSLRLEPLGNGITRTFTADLDNTLQAAEEALVTAGLRQFLDCPDSVNRHLEVGERVHCIGPFVNKVDDHTLVIGATKGEREWSGEQIRVVVQQTAPNQTTVYVISKYRTETIVGRRGDYAETILNEIARRLKLP